MKEPLAKLEFRDVARGRALQARLERAMERAGRAVTVMHVCGSHEQAIARYGLRARFPAGLRVQMGPGCPVCVTDAPEIDACVALATRGVRVLTYGDMLRVPGRARSLDDARAAGARVEVIYAATQAAEIARATEEPVVFFATGFETTAVATAAVLLAEPPANLFVLSAHKWVPAAMDVVASSEGSAIEGYLAAGHAATITGCGVFEPFVSRYRRPVVVAGFEPLDILSGLVLLVEQVIEGKAEVVNAFPSLRLARRQPARAGRAVARLRARRRGLARHRARPQRRSAPAAPARGPRRQRALRGRARRGADAGGAGRRGGVQMRRHHDRSAAADRLPPVRHLLPPRRPGRGLHGEHRGRVQDLARARARSGERSRGEGGQP